MRWQDICISFERAKKLWFDNCKTIDIEAGYLTADAVHLMEVCEIFAPATELFLNHVNNHQLGRFQFTEHKFLPAEARHTFDRVSESYA